MLVVVSHTEAAAQQSTMIQGLVLRERGLGSESLQFLETTETPADPRVEETIDKCDLMIGIMDHSIENSDREWGCPAQWERALERNKEVMILDLSHSDRGETCGEQSQHPQVQRLRESLRYLFVKVPAYDHSLFQTVIRGDVVPPIRKLKEQMDAFSAVVHLSTQVQGQCNSAKASTKSCHKLGSMVGKIGTKIGGLPYAKIDDEALGRLRTALESALSLSAKYLKKGWFQQVKTNRSGEAKFKAIFERLVRSVRLVLATFDPAQSATPSATRTLHTLTLLSRHAPAHVHYVTARCFKHIVCVCVCMSPSWKM